MEYGDRRSDGPISLADVLAPERVCVLQGGSKREALNTLIERLSSTPEITDARALASGIFERESLMSTGIGLNVAVPHVRLPSIRDVVMAAGISPEGVADYESLDGQPVRIMLMIAARPDQHAVYLRLLALVSTRLKDDALRARLLACNDANSFYRVLTGDPGEK